MSVISMPPGFLNWTWDPFMQPLPRPAFGSAICACLASNAANAKVVEGKCGHMTAVGRWQDYFMSAPKAEAPLVSAASSPSGLHELLEAACSVISVICRGQRDSGSPVACLTRFCQVHKERPLRCRVEAATLRCIMDVVLLPHAHCA